MTKHILLLAALGLGLTALSAQAQTTVFDHDGGRNCDIITTTYPDGSTSTGRYFYDRNGSLETIKRTSTEPTAPAEPTAPTAYQRPLSLQHDATRVQPQASVNTLSVRRSDVQQPQVVVVSQSDAEMHAASLAGAARVKAQNEAAAASAAAHKKHRE
jgi:hypothetical protein